MSILEGLTPVYTITGRDTATGYRLPTESEWQFAARGGNSTKNFTYARSNTIADVAWYVTNSASTTHTVGGWSANELGLYAMTGNEKALLDLPNVGEVRVGQYEAVKMFFFFAGQLMRIFTP